MRPMLLGIVSTTFAMTAWPSPVYSQGGKKPPPDPSITREKLFLAGWDPDEPVPAYLYYKMGNKAMPVVIFMHGMGGSKEQYAERMRDWAGKGLFVVTIDAHLHGERKVPGVEQEAHSR